MKIAVTGGAVIGSAVIRHLIKDTSHQVLNIDKLTYAGNLQSLECVESSSHYYFEQTDICDDTKLTNCSKISSMRSCI